MTDRLVSHKPKSTTMILTLTVRRLVSVALLLIAQLALWSVDANNVEDVVEYGADVVRAKYTIENNIEGHTLDSRSILASLHVDSPTQCITPMSLGITLGFLTI
jgi:hypothetical protein